MGDVTLQTYRGCANNSADESQIALGKKMQHKDSVLSYVFQKRFIFPKATRRMAFIFSLRFH